MASDVKDLLTFIVEEQRFAIELLQVERVIRAVKVTTLLGSPGFIEGVIDYYGEVIAVINLRKRLGYPLHEVCISDRFIIVKTINRKLALIVDEVVNVLSPDPQDSLKSINIHKGLKFISLLRNDEGIIFIYDIESLLETEEEIQLRKFLETNFSSIPNL